MNTLSKLILALLLLSGATIPSHAQIKNEKEERIKSADVPKKARQFMHECGIVGKIKWYREYSNQGIHIEGKTVHQGIKHSIEFDTLGQILDIEREFKIEQLDANTVNNITQALSSLFQRLKIRKIQQQWTGNESSLVSLMLGVTEVQNYRLRYEIVVTGKREGNTGYFEVLLEPDGALVELLRISRRASDNLDF